MSRIGSFSGGGGGGGITTVNGGTNITVNTVGSTATVNLDDDVTLNGFLNANQIEISTPGVGGDAVHFTQQAYVQTTDNTLTTLVQLVVPEGEMLTVKAMVNGFKSTRDQSLGAEVLVTIYRPNGGDVTMVGSEMITINRTDAVNVSTVNDVGSQSLLLQVSGLAGQTWNWVTTFSYMYMSDGQS